MKYKNQRIYSNREHLEMLADEQRNYIGREFKLDLEEGCLTIFAKPQPKPKKKREPVERDKTREKYERRT